MIINKKEAFHIPGFSSKICEEEHLERYTFASGFVRGKMVLDIACGVGYGSEIMARSGASYVLGCDIMQENIVFAQNNYNNPNLKFKQKDATKSINEGQFDIVVSFETIEHVENYSGVIKSLYESLRVGGHLIISSPNRKITDPYLQLLARPSFEFHFREFKREEFYLMLEFCGFKSIKQYGQRHQFYFHSPFLEKHFKRLFKPSKHSSPVVTPILANREPEYFVFVAEK
ncbi:MAG: methyltransferase domain-containing protein [Desulfobulbaceae bacterium]|nr:methyltransferase domain-containing protein [Desulfobulbaceae bacterium]MDP2104415.1 methyltransferase domain-containing protein [Desulfobulbaceae bacterium]